MYTPMKYILLLALLSIPAPGIAEEKGISGLTAHNINDSRKSLGLSLRMKHRLLSNMRAQLAATQTIIGLLAEGKFETAEKIARTRLAMTEDMKQVDDAAKNEGFKKLSQVFHTSADELANKLQTKDLKKSLQALRTAMGYCVQCHDKFRQ